MQQALTSHVTVSAHRLSSAQGPGVSEVMSDEYHQVDCETTGEKGKGKKKRKKKKEKENKKKRKKRNMYPSTETDWWEGNRSFK